jgi:hypothetical protein
MKRFPEGALRRAFDALANVLIVISLLIIIAYYVALAFGYDIPGLTR